MSALGSVAVTAIIAILILASISFFLYIFSTNVSYVYSIAQTSANNLKKILNVKLAIGEVTYSGSTLCMNLSNEGSSSIVLDRGSLMLLDYISLNTSSRRILLIPYDRITVNRVLLNNRSYVVKETTAIELLPGATVELCTSIDDVDTSKPLVIVFSLPIGVKISKITYLG